MRLRLCSVPVSDGGTRVAEVECHQKLPILGQVGWGVDRQAESGCEEILQVVDSVIDERDP